jgi:serine protease Do/serine protease DegQ
MSAGLLQGDIITSVNRKEVNNLQELTEILQNNGKTLLLNIRRGNGALFLYIQ